MEESYEWMRSDRTLPSVSIDEFEMQPLLVSRAKYQRAVEMALGGRGQTVLLKNSMIFSYTRRAAKEVEKLHQKIGNLSDILM